MPPLVTSHAILPSAETKSHVCRGGIEPFRCVWEPFDTRFMSDEGAFGGGGVEERDYVCTV